MEAGVQVLKQVIRAGAFAAALGFASPSSAQYQEVYVVSVRPGSEAAFEKVFGSLREAADKTDGSLEWLVFEVVTGKTAPTYRIVVPFAAWEQRDRWRGARQLLSAAFGADAGGRLWSRAHEGVESIETEVWQALPDSDSHPRSEVANFYEVYVREVRAGTEREIRDLHRKFKQAYDVAPSRPSVARSVLVYGRNQGLVFRRASAFDRWADLDNAEARAILSSHFGAEASRAMVDTVRAAAVWTDHFVTALRRDLSRIGQE